MPWYLFRKVGTGPLSRSYCRQDTDADGRLELTGLPQHWSGQLWLDAGFRVVSTTQGDILAGARGVGLGAPAVDILVRIAAQPSLRGRLVQPDGTPLMKAQLMASLRTTSGAVGAGGRTDADGCFSFDYAPGQVSSFELYLGLGARGHPPILSREGDAVPADGDLGEIVVDGVRQVAFRLSDPQGVPIARGVAEAGPKSEPTGEDGRGIIDWVPGTVTTMRVQAPGFVPTAAPIPAVLQAPIEVTMEPANELRVALRLPDGAEPRQFKVVLSGAERITATPVENQMDQLRHAAEWSYPPSDLYGRPHDSFLCTPPDSQGVATFRALRDGVALELRVVGISGDMVYHGQQLPPLAQAEHREVVVPLDKSMYGFRGRVLDPDGAPLARAVVQLDGQMLGFTDDAGVFRCWLAGPKTGTLLLLHNGFATRYLRDYTVPLDGAPVEFRLDPARPLLIEVVDENGAPVPEAEVYIHTAGFTSNTHRVEGNRHRAPSMPPEPFELEARLGGREYRAAHDPALATARVVVPVQGRVVARLDAGTTAGRGGRFVLVLRPPAGVAAQPVTAGHASAPDLRLEIPAVLPGSYQASLSYEPTTAEREAGGQPMRSEAVPVTVEAGRESEVHLALPAASPGRG